MKKGQYLYDYNYFLNSASKYNSLKEWKEAEPSVVRNAYIRGYIDDIRRKLKWSDKTTTLKIGQKEIVFDSFMDYKVAFN